MPDTHKTVTLADDEFNPNEQFKNKRFVGYARLPNEVAEIHHGQLSEGAKLLYAVLIRFAGEYGAAFPFKETLRHAMGGRSLRTISRYQRELEDYGLIRVLVKGRWLANNYYFLKASCFGGASVNDVGEVIRRKTKAQEQSENRAARRAINRSKRFEAIADASVAQEYAAPVNPYPFPWNHLLTYNPVQQAEWGAHPSQIKWQLDMKAWFDGGQVGPEPEELYLDYDIEKSDSQPDISAIEQPEAIEATEEQSGSESRAVPSDWLQHVNTQMNEGFHNEERIARRKNPLFIAEWEKMLKKYWEDFEIFKNSNLNPRMRPAEPSMIELEARLYGEVARNN